MIVLRTQLGGDPSSSANEWLKVVGDIHDTVGQLQIVQGRLERLQCEVEVVGSDHDADGEVRGGGEGGWREACGCVDRISDLVMQVEQLDRLHNYLTWLGHIQQLRYDYNIKVQN